MYHHLKLTHVYLYLALVRQAFTYGMASHDVAHIYYIKLSSQLSENVLI